MRPGKNLVGTEIASKLEPAVSEVEIVTSPSDATFKFPDLYIPCKRFRVV